MVITLSGKTISVPENALFCPSATGVLSTATTVVIADDV